MDAEPGPDRWVVLSRNLYLGAPESLLFGESCSELPSLGKRFFDAVESTCYPARAKAFAKEIAARRPHLVGLQEVFSYRAFADPEAPIQSTPEAPICLDFLAILMAEIEALGLSYFVAARSRNTSHVLPTIGDGGVRFQVSVTDEDVILVRGDCWVRGAKARGYAQVQQAPLPKAGCGRTLVIQQGYCWVDVRWNEQELRFVNTHLADSTAGKMGEQQAEELVRQLSLGVEQPVILVGDLNSDPDDPGKAAPYNVFSREGFRDAPCELSSPAGHTFGEKSSLDNRASTLSMRIDFIFGRGPVRFSSFERFGCRPEDRIPMPTRDEPERALWPSDHVGIAASFVVDRKG